MWDDVTIEQSLTSPVIYATTALLPTDNSNKAATTYFVQNTISGLINFNINNIVS